MAMTKNQRFGLIVFFILLALAILVTLEPWKSADSLTGSAAPGGAPPVISLNWEKLETAYPFSPFQDTILRYTGFDLAYSELHEQASWVAYVLTREEVESSTTGRSDNFRPDTLLSGGSASLADYRGSGFDRGHLAPAGDMKWSRDAMSESFLLSNMSPQYPSFNRGIWKKLEEKVREWAVEMDSIYVITGPVLGRVDSTIGENRVSIPEYYYKVLVDLSPPDHSFIAFLLPNAKSSADLASFAITVDSLEAFTGIDFFATAPDRAMIDWLEQHAHPQGWQ